MRKKKEDEALKKKKQKEAAVKKKQEEEDGAKAKAKAAPRQQATGPKVWIRPGMQVLVGKEGSRLGNERRFGTCLCLSLGLK